jgi:hypothetical protein
MALKTIGLIKIDRIKQAVLGKLCFYYCIDLSPENTLKLFNERGLTLLGYNEDDIKTIQKWDGKESEWKDEKNNQVCEIVILKNNIR